MARIELAVLYAGPIATGNMVLCEQLSNKTILALGRRATGSIMLFEFKEESQTKHSENKPGRLSS
ncbi:MAG: hypothetical protein ACI90C_000640 [Rhodoferax sp.]|jgi:hypothetical protein